MSLWIQLTVTGHYPSRVPPFGNPWINAYLQLPRTYRSLSRPSSAISALASTLRSYSLDLASPRSPFLRLLRWFAEPRCEFLSSTSALLTGILRAFAALVHLIVSFPVQFSRCVPNRYPVGFEGSCEPSKRYSEEIKSDISIGLTAFACHIHLFAFAHKRST